MQNQIFKIPLTNKDTPNGVMLLPKGGLQIKVTLCDVLYQQMGNDLLRFIYDPIANNYKCIEKMIVISILVKLLLHTSPRNEKDENKCRHVIEKLLIAGKDVFAERINKLENEIILMTEIKTTLTEDIFKNFNYNHTDKHLKHDRGCQFFKINGKTRSHSYILELKTLFTKDMDEVILSYSKYQPEIKNQTVKTLFYILCKVARILTDYINYLNESVKNVKENPICVCNKFGGYLSNTKPKVAYWHPPAGRNTKELHVYVNDSIVVKRSDNVENYYVEGNQLVVAKNKDTKAWNLWYDGDSDAKVMDESKIKKEYDYVEFFTRLEKIREKR